MRTLSAVAVACLLLLTAATGTDDLIDRYGGGGTLRSPDGAWMITAPGSPVDEADDVTSSPAFLQGRGVNRHLTDYPRLLGAVWPEDGRHVLLNLIDLHVQRLEVHTLGAKETGHPRRIMDRITAGMRDVRPIFGQIYDQRLAFGRSDTGACVLVEQAGLPPGRDEGSFVVRRAAFDLDLGAEAARATGECLGARLE